MHQVNTKIKLDVPKVVDVIDIEDMASGDKKVCVCVFHTPCHYQPLTPTRTRTRALILTLTTTNTTILVTVILIVIVIVH